MGVGDVVGLGKFLDSSTLYFFIIKILLYICYMRQSIYGCGSSRELYRTHLKIIANVRKRLKKEGKTRTFKEFKKEIQLD